MVPQVLTEVHLVLQVHSQTSGVNGASGTSAVNGATAGTSGANQTSGVNGAKRNLRC
jgi:hypothetical protein